MKSHLLVLNPKAGSGRGLEAVQRVEGLYRKAGIPFQTVSTEGPGHAVRLARDEAAGHSAIVAVGGDGTVHEVVNGLAEAAQAAGGPDRVAALGVLPVGTGNDFVKSLGFPRDEALAFTALTQGRRRRIDLGHAGPLWVPGPEPRRVEREWFVNDFSAGFGALVARDMVRPSLALRALPGRIAYTLAGLRRGLARAWSALVRLDGVERHAEHFEVHVGNGRFCGGGAQFTPHAVLDDGLLDVTRLHTVSRFRNFLTMLLHLQRGTLAPRRGVDFERARHIEIEQPAGFPVYLDGDWREAVPSGPRATARVRIEVAPAALDVLAFHGPGLATA